MKVIDKENNIVEDICPSCGKDGATIQTTEYGDGSKYIEVMCLNGCGHFARIIKRESELIYKQMDNEEWFDTLDTWDKGMALSKVVEELGSEASSPYFWADWLKAVHEE